MLYESLHSLPPKIAVLLFLFDSFFF